MNGYKVRKVLTALRQRAYADMTNEVNRMAFAVCFLRSAPTNRCT